MSNPMPDWAALFNTLSTDSSSDGQLVAIPIPELTSHRIARDSNGFPHFLISVQETDKSSLAPSVLLEHLAVEHNVLCRIKQHEGKVEEGRFTVISCVNANNFLKEYFLKTVGTVVMSLGANPTQQQIVQTIQRLVDLFRALTQAPKQSTQGLWAELFLIAYARDTVTLLECWRETPEDHFDFKLGNQRIEVKSTVNSMRQHFFSLEQLRPENDIQVLIASIFIQRSGAGTSIQQLLDRIRLKVYEYPELLTRLDLTVAATLGNGLQFSLGEQYDEQKALSSLTFFKNQQIPSIERPLPDEISDLRFRVDLGSCSSETRAELKAANGLFKAALRSR